MSNYLNSVSTKSLMAVLVTSLGVCAGPTTTRAGDKPKGQAMIQLSAEGPSPFVLTGTAPHIGKYRCIGEFEFAPGDAEGSLVGVGVAVLQAANGDLIVGVVTCLLDGDGIGQIHFSWRDSVEFSDGTIVGTTGRFVKHRPPGVVIAIIAILIG